MVSNLQKHRGHINKDYKHMEEEGNLQLLFSVFWHPLMKDFSMIHGTDINQSSQCVTYGEGPCISRLASLTWVSNLLHGVLK